MLKIGDKVRVRFDDSNPQLKNREGVVVRESNGQSPNWVDVKIEGETYPLRGDELFLLSRGEHDD